MLPIANLKPSSSCNYGARREPLHNKPRSAKRSAKRSATITLTTDNQRLMKDKNYKTPKLLLALSIMAMLASGIVGDATDFGEFAMSLMGVSFLTGVASVVSAEGISVRVAAEEKKKKNWKVRNTL